MHSLTNFTCSRAWRGIIARIVLDLGHQSHVSGLLVQPLFTTAGPDVIREVGPDQGHGLDIPLTQRRFSRLDDRPINIMPSAPPQPVTPYGVFLSLRRCNRARRHCGYHPSPNISYPAAARASARYWGARWPAS